jgi:hypothetical protein
MRHIESGCTPPYAPRLRDLAAADRKGHVQDLPPASRLEAVGAVFAENQRQ